MFSLRLENENANIVDINDGVNYIVTAVSGLKPPSASIFTAKSPNRKGVKYNGSTLNERNIVITIKILGDIEANRNALYAWVDTEQYAKIYYQNDIKSVYCEGHVEDCDVDLFSDNEIMNVAIICEDPYFKDLEDISTDITSLMKQFKIPFAIKKEGVPFSTIRDNNVTVVFNGGAETGAKFYIKTTDEVRNLVLYDATDATKRFVIRGSIPANWTIIIDTDASPKTCKAYRSDGTVQNMLPFVGANPTWFTLKKGYNKFGYTVDEGASNVTISVRFTNKYLGV
jgi:hypothetical protein